uniref:Transporter n=1 Tax=Sinocyclocheilus grahami TaxID=75366 RepID=A0A672N906_SINGR
VSLTFPLPHLNDSNESNKQDPHVGQEDENTDRGNWSSKREYMLSMIGYAVGLGNVWRFPYLAYKHGGGAFLIPYTIMLAVAGLPLFFMESSFGQFCSQGPINVWKAVPILQGVGITMMLVSTFLAIYYNVIIAYSIYYLFASFQYPLPWSVKDCNSTGLLDCFFSKETEMYTTVQMFSVTVALQRSSSMNETGPVVWHLALCLLLAWILVGAALFKGIKSSGKVVYFTATFPYVVLFILLIRGVTLEGAKDGIEFYIGSKSNLTKLTDSEVCQELNTTVWKDAATQIFFSLSIAWGGLMALSSYNKFYNNCYQDSIIVCVTNCGTSVFAGFAIFSILGHMAHVYQRPVSEVANAERDKMSPICVLGFGLAFIAYPDALSKLPISPLWSILFFVMLVTLGLDSQFAGIEVISTCLQDAYPKLLKSKRGIVTTAVCIVLFLLGLPCVTRAGIYWVNLIDTFCAGWILLVAGLLEVLGLSVLYGGNRFIKDIEMMIGSKSTLFWLWWRACWFFITPVILSLYLMIMFFCFFYQIILVWSLYTFTSPTYGSVAYPDWGISLGWCLTAFSLIWIPIFAVWKVYKASGGPCVLMYLYIYAYVAVCVVK